MRFCAIRYLFVVIFLISSYFAAILLKSSYYAVEVNVWRLLLHINSWNSMYLLRSLCISLRQTDQRMQFVYYQKLYWSRKAAAANTFVQYSLIVKGQVKQCCRQIIYPMALLPTSDLGFLKFPLKSILYCRRPPSFFQPAHLTLLHRCPHCVFSSYLVFTLVEVLTFFHWTFWQVFYN